MGAAVPTPRQQLEQHAPHLGLIAIAGDQHRVRARGIVSPLSDPGAEAFGEIRPCVVRTTLAGPDPDVGAQGEVAGQQVGELPLINATSPARNNAAGWSG